MNLLIDWGTRKLVGKINDKIYKEIFYDYEEHPPCGDVQSIYTASEKLIKCKIRHMIKKVGRVNRDIINVYFAGQYDEYEQALKIAKIRTGIKEVGYYFIVDPTLLYYIRFSGLGYNPFIVIDIGYFFSRIYLYFNTYELGDTIINNIGIGDGISSIFSKWADYIYSTYSIDSITLEELERSYVAIIKNEDRENIEIVKKYQISLSDLEILMYNHFQEIVSQIYRTIYNQPKEITSSVFKNGIIILTGGGSYNRILFKMIKEDFASIKLNVVQSGTSEIDLIKGLEIFTKNEEKYVKSFSQYVAYLKSMR